MSFCDKCGVEVEETLHYCPLCGRCVNEQASNTPSLYPTDQAWKKNRLLAINLFKILLMIAVLAAGLIDIFLLKRVYLFLHTLFPALLIYFSILLPIKNRWSLSNQNNVFLILAVIYLIWLEWFTPTKGWALPYVIPLTLLASSVYNALVIVLRRYNRFEHLLILITSALLSIAVFITNFAKGFVTWPIISAFSATIGLLLFVVILNRKKVKNELAKKFHI